MLKIWMVSWSLTMVSICSGWFLGVDDMIKLDVYSVSNACCRLLLNDYLMLGGPLNTKDMSGRTLTSLAWC